MKASTSRQKQQSSALLIVVSSLLLFILVLFVITCRQQKQTAGKTQVSEEAVSVEATALRHVQLPAVRPGDAVIEHAGYTLAYNEEHEQATWVAYVLSHRQQLLGNVSRTNNFSVDPLVRTQTAGDADYEGSGYDRGHLAPAEDMDWSKKAMKASFYYSNISPQVPAFNRGVWRRLEELVRYWATEYDSLYVVTGPVLTNNLPVIGPNKVSVPGCFYKVVLDYDARNVRGIGFVLRNQASSAPLQTFAVPIDSVEHLTGLDFFPLLPDAVEEKMESRAEVTQWLWTRKQIKR